MKNCPSLKNYKSQKCVALVEAQIQAADSSLQRKEMTKLVTYIEADKSAEIRKR